MILFGFNRGERKAAAEFAVATPDGNLKATDLETKETVPSQYREGRLHLINSLEPGAAWVVLLDKK